MRILVVDDHELVRKGICSVLAAKPGLDLCGEAVDGLDAIEKAKALRPDVVIMDISLPKMNGLEATREIKRLLPNTEIVIVSQHGTPEMVRQAFNAGARAYVGKSEISTHLLTAVVKASQHESFVGAPTLSDTTESAGAREAIQRTAVFEQALRESEERFHSAMTSLAEGLYTIDAEGLVTYVNPAAEAMFGWSASELFGKKMHDVTHYQYPNGAPFPATECPGLQVLQKGVELREYADSFIRKDGSFFPVIFSASPLKSDGRTVGIVVSFRDDTRRRQAEDSLRDSERIYRAIGESMDYGVWICDAKGRNVYASPSFLQLLGLTQEQCSEFGWAHALHPEDAEKTISSWKDCVREGRFWERQHRVRGIDGAWHHIFARGGPIRDAQGNILHWAGINLGIQKQKETEQQLQHLVQTLEVRIQDRTRQLENATDKLRELSGRLLQTQDEERRRIARELHDSVGQLLAALSMNFSNLTTQITDPGAEVSQSLHEIANLIGMASKETRTMSHLLHPPLLDEVGLESALRWFVDGFAERSKINVRTKLAQGLNEGLPRDLALAIFRIVQECLANVHRHSGSPTALVAIERSRNEISLEVKDEGRGIPPEIRARISSGESYGVGLRGMRERIRQFGGRWEITSDENGTRISAILPIPDQLDGTDSEFTKAHRATVETEVEKRHRVVTTILCIDDEEAGLLPRRLLLESAGHRVIEARSGAEGIQRFRSEKVDAVILDYWMSGMKGTAVASELRRIDPAVPIIVLSGMSDLPGEAAGLVDQWLVKGSHRPEQLLASINTMLERRPV